MKNSWKKLFFIIHPECEELKEWIKNVAKRMRKKKIKKGKNIKKTIATSEKNRFSHKLWSNRVHQLKKIIKAKKKLKMKNHGQF